MIDNTNNLKGRILGTCMLQELIGQGGMSAVYLAQQQHLSRQVAVKILLPKVSTGSKLHEQFLLRFQHEADIIAKLDHINIIPIYEYAEQDGDAYLVIPYLTGGSLHNLLARYGSLSLQQTMNYIAQAASALDYAHLHGVIHRDLKPGNFLLHADGRLVLTDFGIAHIVRDSSRTNYPTLTGPDLLLGTPDYMSPEMVRGERVDHRSDIYQLGIVLFQMLSGDIPFKDDNPYAVLLKRLQEPVPLLHPTNSSIPQAVDDVIQKATAVNREDRFTSAGELARALQSAIAGPYYMFQGSLPHTQAMPVQPLFPIQQTEMIIQAPSQMNRKNEELLLKNHTSTRVTTSPKRLFSAFVGLCLIAVVALITGGILNAQGRMNTTNAPPSHSASEYAKSAVKQFYDDIDQWKYSQAFRLLSGNYCNFVNGYASTLHDKVMITGTTPNTDGSYKVAITLKATELLPAGQVITTYQGYEIVRKGSDGTWKIVEGGHLPKISRTPNPVAPLVDSGAPSSQQAQAVIQQFYSDINQGNYPGAYSLWGTRFQTSTTYCSFVQGFAHTKHDSVRFNSYENLANGTIKILYTVYATEDNHPGVQSYDDIDLAGQNEYGLWKILEGSQTKN